MQNSEAVPFSLLGGGPALDEAGLLNLYGYPAALNRCLVRGNAIASVDGGATTDGTSGGLGGPGDRRLFALLRELADVILVGAGTARVEGYSGARMNVAQRLSRQTRGQGEVPPIALVTRTGMIDRHLPVLTDTEVAPLVLTTAAAADGARTRLGAAAEVIACSGADSDAVDLGVVLDTLSGRGLHRVLAEGGPSLLGSLIEVDLLDELCLTSAPVLAGGSAVRVATGAGAVLTRLRRAHALTDDEGYLYLRYVRSA